MSKSQNHEELHLTVTMNSSLFFCLASMFTSLENPAHPKQRTTKCLIKFRFVGTIDGFIFSTGMSFLLLARASCSSTLHTATEVDTFFLPSLAVQGHNWPQDHDGGFAGQGRCQDDLRRDSLPRTKGQISFAAVEDSLPSSKGRRHWPLLSPRSTGTRYCISKRYDPA